MKGQALALLFSLAMFNPSSPLCAATATATCKVLSIDFSTGTISLDKGNDCPADKVNFNKDTKFEFGPDNPVDSSKLVVAKTIEFECPITPGPATKITIRDTSDEYPPLLTVGKELGDFPLDKVVASVNPSDRSDPFSSVEDDADTRDGVLTMRLKQGFTFSTGYCRVIPYAKNVQCDYEYSNTLASILVGLVGNIAAKLKLEKQAPDASTQTYIDPKNRVLVRLLLYRPTFSMVVQVY
jgi:hypothetical protein